MDKCLFKCNSLIELVKCAYGFKGFIFVFMTPPVLVSSLIGATVDPEQGIIAFKIFTPIFFIFALAMYVITPNCGKEVARRE